MRRQAAEYAEAIYDKGAQSDSPLARVSDCHFRWPEADDRLRASIAELAFATSLALAYGVELGRTGVEQRRLRRPHDDLTCLDGEGSSIPPARRWQAHKGNNT